MRIATTLAACGALALLLASAWSSIPTQEAQAAQALTMKAVRYSAYGGPEVLEYVDVPRPEPKPGEVLVHVRAAGVNPVDWKMRQGGPRSKAPKKPVTPGFDIAGEVERVGADVKQFKAGDKVWAMLTLSHSGGYAQYVAVPEAELALRPKSLDDAHAAAVPLAALTAWQALFDTAELKAGQTVLIHAGAGGVGHFAVQLAKWKGAKVIATASDKNLAFVKDLGADTVIDYKAQKFEELVKDVDVVFDLIGGDTLARSYSVLKQGGFVVSIVAQPSPDELKLRELRGTVFLVVPNTEQLLQIGALIEAGKLKPVVSEILPLSDARKAQEQSQVGHTRGKLVLDTSK